MQIHSLKKVHYISGHPFLFIFHIETSEILFISHLHHHHPSPVDYEGEKTAFQYNDPYADGDPA